MMKFELINPSDQIFLTAESAEVASLVALILGHGMYGLKEVNGDFEMPPMVDDDWFKSVLGLSAQKTFDKTSRDALREAFYSVHRAGIRSSLNDIVATAHFHAKQFIEEPDDVREDDSGD